MDIHDKKLAIANLKRAQGMIDKVISMLGDEECECVDTVRQSLASIGLIKSANNEIIKNHLKNCFRDAVMSDDDDEQDRIINELLSLNKVASK